MTNWKAAKPLQQRVVLSSAWAFCYICGVWRADHVYPKHPNEMSNRIISFEPNACCFEVLFLTSLSHESSPSDKGKVTDLITQVWKVMILRGCTLLLCTTCYYAVFKQI